VTSGDVLSQWLQHKHGSVVQGSLVSLSRGGLLRVSSEQSRAVQVLLPVMHGGQAAVARAVDQAGTSLALRVQAVSSDSEKARQMERLVNMTTVAEAARAQPQRFPAVLPVHESFVLVVPGADMPTTAPQAEYELWCDIMAWCPNDLNGWAKAVPVGSRQPAVVLRAFVPLLATVCSVHQDLGIVHRDITPNNVLVDEHGRLLLADWGIAHGIAADQTSTYTQLIGNRGFSLPPEMLAGDPSVGRYTDAWYLGSLLAWMLTGAPPGPQHGPEWLPPGLPSGPLGDQVTTVIQALCCPDPRGRADLGQAQVALANAAAGRMTANLPAVRPARTPVVAPPGSTQAQLPRTVADAPGNTYAQFPRTAVDAAPGNTHAQYPRAVIGVDVGRRELPRVGFAGWGWALFGPVFACVLLALPFVLTWENAPWRSQADDRGTTQDGTTQGGTGTSAADAATYSAARVEEILADLYEATGGTEFTRINMFTDYVVATARTAPGASTFDRYTWRNGKVTHQAATIQPKPEEVFDAAGVDWTLAEKLADQVPQLTGVDEPNNINVQVYLLSKTTLVFQLGTRNDYYHPWIRADKNGKILTVSTDVPGYPPS